MTAVSIDVGHISPTDEFRFHSPPSVFMIPSQLLYILVGALFSTISTLCLSSYQDYKQSIRTRRVLFGEMESMKGLLESMSREDNDKRSVRTQIDEQISTKMYEQHLPNLGRLRDDEIEPVISFYRQMKSIQDSHETYNQAMDAETPEDREKRKEQSTNQWFASYSIHVASEKALKNLAQAQKARKKTSFVRYILSNLVP